jgi:LytS/YehU family sensor histidine kinase
LDSNATGVVTLGTELRIVQDYLEIESARFGPRLRFSIDVAAEFHGVEVPPFSVQTLVENSVKHVVGARREGGSIHVSARELDGRLVISVKDDGLGFDAGSLPKGHGLQLLEARLAALHDGKAVLRFEREAAGMVVEVQVPS